MPKQFLTDVDLRAGLLVAGSAGTSTQVLTSNGPGAAPSWETVGGSSTATENRIDASVERTIYVGEAAAGSAEGAAVWTIVRTRFNYAGVRTGKSKASNVTWTGRTTHFYS